MATLYKYPNYPSKKYSVKPKENICFNLFRIILLIIIVILHIFPICLRIKIFYGC